MIKIILKKLSTTLLTILSAIIVMNSLTVTTSAQVISSNIPSELGLSTEDIEFLSKGQNLNYAMSLLQSLPLDSNNSRSFQVTDNLIIEEELTSIIKQIERGTTTRQVTSTVNLKNNIGFTVATLTATGYFRHNSIQVYAYDADATHQTGAFYKASSYISYIGTTPVYGYARTTSKFHVSGSLGFEWGNNILGSANISGNVYCNQYGNYYSQWF